MNHDHHDRTAQEPHDEPASPYDSGASHGVSRRKLLAQALAPVLGTVPIAGLLGACGGDSAATDDIAQARASSNGSALQAAVTPDRIDGKYRFQQPYLLQSSPSRTIEPRVAGGFPYAWDVYGPTYAYVDVHTGWSWTQPGGDWTDREGVRYGNKPWFSVVTDKGVGASFIAMYDADITALAQHVQSSGRWFALLLTAPIAPRTIAGFGHDTVYEPYVRAWYADGSFAFLSTRTIAPSSRSSTLPNTTAAAVTLPAFVEFERPQQAITRAEIVFTVVEHWSGTPPVIEGYLLDPPINTDLPLLGVARESGALDADIERVAGVLGAHRYVDGTTLTDFAHPEGMSIVERNFDPAIYGNGPSDTALLPHLELGKWINGGPLWSIVPSSYSGDGFEPLAQGVGALRIAMPAEPGVGDGSIVNSHGTGAGNGMIFMPEPLYGRLDHIFVRYYVRLGTPYTTTNARRFNVYHSPGSPAWTTFAGKFGIAPDHSNTYGGVSGTSGGGRGWQMRLSWYECDAGNGGPDEGGWAPGFHLYDFQQNPAGYNYGKGDGGMTEQFGMIGGLGGMLYAGRWYCIETELALNTVMAEAPGFVPDGELRAWIDGRLVYERKGMVFRQLPLIDAAPDPEQLRPCRELGITALWLNWFHGGKTVNTVDRTLFYTGLVWSRSYIGPMKHADASVAA